MQRSSSLLAAAALTCAATAQAQSSPTLYGLIDLSAGRFQSAGQPSIRGLEADGMTTSFLGIKGTDDLGGGLKARFQLESFIRANSGASGRFDGDAFFSRDSFVGLQGAFGSTVLGRNTTPFFLSTTSFNPFGDSFGFAPSVRQYYRGTLLGDRSWNNSLAYTNPYDSPLRLSLIANASQGAPGSTGKNLGASVFYVAGPFAATAALQRVRNSDLPLPAGFVKQDAYQIGATYDLVALRLFGQYGKVRTITASAATANLFQVGASVPIGAGALLVSYGQAELHAGASPTNRTLSLGYDYNLSKNTDLYAVYMNDRASGLTTGHTLATGMRLRF